jgi:hypothetical protein
VSKAEQALKAKADGRWKSVKQRLGLSADLAMESVYHCFLARLAPELYPYRPKISFLIQYWKKAESMQRVLEPILKCKDVVSSHAAGYVIYRLVITLRRLTGVQKA